ncbi:MAG: four helix bundle protein [Verrucomicrobia bacterium]|nr:MAG: four helix bundle protein [Verrucomicrobiota bacterium]PYM09525.1 MAG: four helix bundle protein [Verrucomicrobiota bacterium]
MAFQSFEDLEVWQRGCRLAVDVFQTFASCRNFTMQDQVQRSALSIPCNVAEGYERNTNKEFVRFLNISKGSSGELRTQLYISRKLDFLTK